MEEKPTTTIKILNNKLTLTGYSRAGDATCIYCPELGYMFDAGETLKYKPSKLFITHCHSDHSYHVPYTYTRGKILDIFAPQETKHLLYSYLKSAQNLNDGVESPMGEREFYSLKPVAPNDIIALSDIYSCQVIKCCHTVPCVGYAFFEKRKKLKAEYATMSGRQVGELRKSGVDVSEEISVPLFAFLGDTTPEVFEQNPVLSTMPYVVVECTFLEGEQSNSKGHMHWQGLEPIVRSHPDTNFVLIHFSHTLKRKQVKDFFEDVNLPNVIPFI